MPLRFNVELRDGSVCPMSTKAFNIFLALDKVARFKRSGGWVVVGQDPLRDLEKVNSYPSVAERRAFV